MTTRLRIPKMMPSSRERRGSPPPRISAASAAEKNRRLRIEPSRTATIARRIPPAAATLHFYEPQSSPTATPLHGPPAVEQRFCRSAPAIGGFYCSVPTEGLASSLGVNDCAVRPEVPWLGASFSFGGLADRPPGVAPSSPMRPRTARCLARSSEMPVHHSLKETDFGYRYCQMVQRAEGLRLHPARRRRQGRVRPYLGRGACWPQLAARGP